MPQVTVKWFSNDKGYGFILPEEGGEELFVHYTDVEGSGFRSLRESETAVYEVTPQGEKGPRAIPKMQIAPQDRRMGARNYCGGGWSSFRRSTW